MIPHLFYDQLVGSVSKVEIDANNVLQIKVLGAVVSTFDTPPTPVFQVTDLAAGYRYTTRKSGATCNARISGVLSPGTKPSVVSL
jgi:hypothetical protein